jgi:hypothetical protein
MYVTPIILLKQQSPVIKARKAAAAASTRVNGVSDHRSEPGIWTKLFGSNNNNKRSKNNVMSDRKYGDIGTLVKTRKAPIKVEPKGNDWIILETEVSSLTLQRVILTHNLVHHTQYSLPMNVPSWHGCI